MVNSMSRRPRPHARRKRKRKAPPERSAVVRGGGRYRYDLWRRWGPPDAPQAICVWVMLNPSRADALIDDPTVRRCVGFSKAWGFTAMRIVNLFAYRMTDPAKLWACKENIVGPMNEHYLRDAAGSGQRVVCAWGAAKDPRVAEQAEALWWLVRHRKPVCLGYSKDGAPRHPLFLRADTEAVLWTPGYSAFGRTCPALL